MYSADIQMKVRPSLNMFELFKLSLSLRLLYRRFNESSFCSAMAPTIKALILDLGDVLFSWQPPKNGKVPPKVLKRAMSTRPWYNFECDIISENDCYSQLGELFSMPSDDVADTIKQAKLVLRPDGKLLNMLKDIRDTSRGGLQIYLMSNTSQPHWDYARGLECEWDIFDQVFTSAGANMRKPDICFYKRVLESIRLGDSPSLALFIDHKIANVYSARAAGMQGLIFDNTDSVVRQVRNMLGDPIYRGLGYLKANAKQLRTTCNTPTHHDIDMEENFAQLLILEATGDRSLVTLKDYHMLWNFFQGQPILTTTDFPNDYDTTSLALTILDGYHPPNVINQILDSSLANQSPDHLPLVYDDPSRPRFDPVACVHIYTLFHLNNRSNELAPTWNYLCDFLDFKAYEQGTYYYAPPEYFLYALARLVAYSQERGIPLPTMTKPANSSRMTAPFLDLFKARCRSRVKTGPSDAMSLALRLIACRVAGIPAADLESDAQNLRSLQEVDGGWPWCEIYRAPSAEAAIGSRGVVTSFAVKALRMMGEDSVEELGHTPRKAQASNWSWTNPLPKWCLWHMRMTVIDKISRTLGMLSDAPQANLSAKGHL